MALALNARNGLSVGSTTISVIDTLGNGTFGTLSATGSSTLQGISGTSLSISGTSAFTLIPTAPTATADTNSTSLATTAFVLGQAAITSPLMDGVAAIGISSRFAKADHVHASDTSRAALAGATFTGDVQIPNLTLTGNLTVNGTTTTINAATLDVADINLTLGKVVTPTDATANGGGLTLLGTTNKTLIWDSANTNWTSSEHFNLATGKSFKINNVSIISSTALGASVTSSSLTSVGTLSSLAVTGNTTLGGNLSITGQLTSTLATGTAPFSVTSTTPVANLSIGGNAATATATTNLQGGNNTTLYGAMHYQVGLDSTVLLAPNTTTAKMFLSQTGSGSTGAAPSWLAITKADVGLSLVENTAISTWAGSANLTTVGTLPSLSVTGNVSSSGLTINSNDTNANKVGSLITLYNTASNASPQVVGQQILIYPSVLAGTSNGNGYYGTITTVLRNYVNSNDAGSVAKLIGSAIEYGNFATNASLSPVTGNATGIQILPYRMSGTISNMIDIYLGADNGTSTVTNRYGIYQLNTGKNIFNGSLTVNEAGSFTTNGATNNSILSLVSNGIAGGQTGTFYGLNISCVPNNAATAAQGINVTAYEATAQNVYGVNASAIGVNSNIIGVSGTATHNNLGGGGTAYAGYFNVYGGTAGTGGTTTAGWFANNAASGANAYGLRVSTVAGATNVIPLTVTHAGTNVLTVSSTGTLIAPNIQVSSVGVAAGTFTVGMADGSDLTTLKYKATKIAVGSSNSAASNGLTSAYPLSVISAIGANQVMAEFRPFGSTVAGSGFTVQGDGAGTGTTIRLADVNNVEKLRIESATGNTTIAGTFTSTLATGTAPFSVTSTTPVTNLSIGGNAAAATKSTNIAGGNNTTLLGSMPYQSNTDTTSLLAPNVTTTKMIMTQTGTGTNGAAPVWSALTVYSPAVTPLPTNLNGGLSYTHGLGFTPSEVMIELTCLVAENGYAVGDVIQKPGLWNGTAAAGEIGLWKNTTQVGHPSVSGYAFLTVGKSTGVAFATATAANWSYRFRIRTA